MKRYKIMIVAVSTLSVLATPCGCDTVRASEPSVTESESYPGVHTFGPAPVVLPVLPHSLEFAGERVPLENYDIRESLMRELLVTSYMHSRTLLTLLSTERYFSVIEPILRRNNIPDDFKYLCMAESGLNPNVVSVAGAAGLWQLMAPAAKNYGLEVGKDIDERYHLEKSTQAACDYLREAYSKLGSWTLAAASYNLGLTGVSSRMDKQGVTEYYDLFLPEETMRYLFRVLSFKLVTASPGAYGFDLPKSAIYPPLTLYTTAQAVGRDIDWSKFAQSQGTTYKMLRELNHWIRSYEYPNPQNRTYEVKIPCEGFRCPAAR